MAAHFDRSRPKPNSSRSPRLEAHEDGGPDVFQQEGRGERIEGGEGAGVGLPFRQGAGGHRRGGAEPRQRQRVVEQSGGPLPYRFEPKRTELVGGAGVIARHYPRAGLQEGFHPPRGPARKHARRNAHSARSAPRRWRRFPRARGRTGRRRRHPIPSGGRSDREFGDGGTTPCAACAACSGFTAPDMYASAACRGQLVSLVSTPFQATSGVVIQPGVRIEGALVGPVFGDLDG